MGGQEKALRVEGLTFVVSEDEEPRIKDLDLAERLGFKQPRMIRKLIKRHLASGAIGANGVCATVSQTSPIGGRPSEEMWLSESAALFIAAKSDTEGGDAVLNSMVALWIAVRRQMAAQSRPVLTAPQPPAIAGTVRESSALRDDLRRLTGANARQYKVSEQKIRGWLARESGAASYLRMPLVLGAYFRDRLMRIACGEEPSPFQRRKALAAHDENQQQLFPRREIPSA